MIRLTLMQATHIRYKVVMVMTLLTLTAVQANNHTVAGDVGANDALLITRDTDFTIDHDSVNDDVAAAAIVSLYTDIETLDVMGGASDNNFTVDYVNAALFPSNGLNIFGVAGTNTLTLIM